MLKALLLCTLVLIVIPDAMEGLPQFSFLGHGYNRPSPQARMPPPPHNGELEPMTDEEELEPMTDEEVEAMTEEEVDMGESEAELGKLREGTTTWGRLLDALEERARRFREKVAHNQRELQELQARIATIGNRRRSLKRTWLVALSAARNLAAGIPPVQDAWLHTKDFFAVFLNRTKVL